MIMKAIQKSIMTASLLLVTLSASAQHATQLEGWMNNEINDMIGHGVEIAKSLGQESDIQKEGRPLKWRCDIYSFTLPKQRRHDFDGIIERFEEFSHEDPNCYAINSMSESSNGDRVGNARNLMIGEDPNNYVIIGKDYTNFINVNVLDAADAAMPTPSKGARLIKGRLMCATSSLMQIFHRSLQASMRGWLIKGRPHS